MVNHSPAAARNCSFLDCPGSLFFFAISSTRGSKCNENKTPGRESGHRVHAVIHLGRGRNVSRCIAVDVVFGVPASGVDRDADLVANAGAKEVAADAYGFGAADALQGWLRDSIPRPHGIASVNSLRDAVTILLERGRADHLEKTLDDLSAVEVVELQVMPLGKTAMICEVLSRSGDMLYWRMSKRGGKNGWAVKCVYRNTHVPNPNKHFSDVYLVRGKEVIPASRDIYIVWDIDERAEERAMNDIVNPSSYYHLDAVDSQVRWSLGLFEPYTPKPTLREQADALNKAFDNLAE